MGPTDFLALNAFGTASAIPAEGLAAAMRKTTQAVKTATALCPRPPPTLTKPKTKANNASSIFMDTDGGGSVNVPAQGDIPAPFFVCTAVNGSGDAGLDSLQTHMKQLHQACPANSVILVLSQNTEQMGLKPQDTGAATPDGPAETGDAVAARDAHWGWASFLAKV